MRVAIVGVGRFLIGSLAALAALGGCGGSTAKPDPVREGRLVAEVNDLCRSVADESQRRHPGQESQTAARLAAVEKALAQAAAYLPVGSALKEAQAQRRALRAQMQKLTGSGGKASFGDITGLLERSYRLDVEVYDDERALGLGPCLGQPPKAPISG